MSGSEASGNFGFYPSLVTFWGMLVANDAKIVHLTFYINFPGHWGHDVFGGHEGVTLDKLLCGVERVQKLNEWKRSRV